MTAIGFRIGQWLLAAGDAIVAGLLAAGGLLVLAGLENLRRLGVQVQSVADADRAREGLTGGRTGSTTFSSAEASPIF